MNHNISPPRKEGGAKLVWHPAMNDKGCGYARPVTRVATCGTGNAMRGMRDVCESCCMLDERGAAARRATQGESCTCRNDEERCNMRGAGWARRNVANRRVKVCAAQGIGVKGATCLTGEERCRMRDGSSGMRDRGGEELHAGRLGSCAVCGTTGKESGLSYAGRRRMRHARRSTSVRCVPGTRSTTASLRPRRPAAARLLCGGGVGSGGSGGGYQNR
jgi:hypothetical protein